jgi:hypothetical protein
MDEVLHGAMEIWFEYCEKSEENRKIREETKAPAPS